MGTFFVALILIAIVTHISISLYRDKKRGKSSCGGNCGACAGCVHRCGGCKE